MHTIPRDQVGSDHAEALALKAALSNLHSSIPAGFDSANRALWITFSELTTARLADFDPAINAWWITDAGLRLLGIDAEPPATYSISWTRDGRQDRAPGDDHDHPQVQRVITYLVARLRSGDPITDIAVVDERTGEDVTAEAARGLIPHAEELEQLERRAAFLAGLAELRDYLIAHPAVPIPSCPSLLCSVDADTDELGRDKVYVAAAALGVDAETNDHGTTRAERQFGPIRYDVYASSAQSMADYFRKDELGRAAFAAEKAQQAEQNGPEQ